MGMDFSIRPVGAPVALPVVVRPTSDATTGAVQTELPEPQAPTQPTTISGASNDNQAATDQTSQNVVIDRAANTIVYQTINQLTGQVLDQFPDDAVLQARAYYTALEQVQLEKSLYDQTA